MPVQAADARRQSVQPFALARQSARNAEYTRSVRPHARQRSTRRLSPIVIPIRVSKGSTAFRLTPDFCEMQSTHSGRSPSRIATSALLSGILVSAVAPAEHITTLAIQILPSRQTEACDLPDDDGAHTKSPSA